MKKSKKLSKKVFPQFEPKANHRFIVNIEGIPPYIIKSAEFPSFWINDADVIYYKDLHMILYDPIAPSGTTAVVEKVKAKTPWDFTIAYLGPVGDIVQKWEVKNPRLVDVQFSRADWTYGPDSASEIILTFSLGEAEVNLLM